MQRPTTANECTVVGGFCLLQVAISIVEGARLLPGHVALVTIGSLFMLWLLLALLARNRLVWWFFLFAGLFGIPAFVTSHHSSLGFVAGLLVGLLQLGLLLSRPMRGYVGFGRLRSR